MNNQTEDKGIQPLTDFALMAEHLRGVILDPEDRHTAGEKTSAAKELRQLMGGRDTSSVGPGAMSRSDIYRELARLKEVTLR